MPSLSQSTDKRQTPSLHTGFSLQLKGISIAAVLMFMTFGCASSAPGLDDPDIRNKLDIRLQMALEDQGAGEPLGEYMRILVHLVDSGTIKDRETLSMIGSVGSMIGPIVTLILKPELVVEVAALERVKSIEFDALNVPMTIPPPSATSITG